MYNKIHSVIFLLFQIKNADTEIGWNVRFPMSVWIVSAETGYLLSEQKKFQNKSKNIYEVYQSVFFRCIMILSYRVAFLCNVFRKLIIHQKVLYDIFLWKSCKVVLHNIIQRKYAQLTGLHAQYKDGFLCRYFSLCNSDRYSEVPWSAAPPAVISPSWW